MFFAGEIRSWYCVSIKGGEGDNKSENPSLTDCARTQAKPLDGVARCCVIFVWRWFLLSVYKMKNLQVYFFCFVHPAGQ